MIVKRLNGESQAEADSRAEAILLAAKTETEFDPLAEQILAVCRHRLSTDSTLPAPTLDTIDNFVGALSDELQAATSAVEAAECRNAFSDFARHKHVSK